MTKKGKVYTLSPNGKKKCSAKSWEGGVTFVIPLPLSFPGMFVLSLYHNNIYYLLTKELYGNITSRRVERMEKLIKGSYELICK